MPQVRIDPAKWARNASAASGDYEQGVRNPRVAWDQAAAASEDVYQAMLTDAFGRKAFSAGIRRAGSAGWQAGIVEKGVARYRGGVVTPGAQQRWNSNFAPFASAIQGVTLPPRGPKGQNYDRVQAIGDALISAKRGRT